MIVNLLKERRLNNGRLSARNKQETGTGGKEKRRKRERKILPRSPVERDDGGDFGRMIADEK
jgi:hypothetical protein